MTCNHIDPSKWSHRIESGQKKAFCMGCGKFMGYVHQETKPAKPEKVKSKNAHV